MREFKTRVEVEVSVQEFHQLFVADSSTFSFDFHLQRGDRDIAVELWSYHEGKYSRTVTYDAPTSSNTLVQKVAGSSIKLTETHYYYYTNSNRDLVVEIHITDEAVRFSVVIKKVITPSDKGSLVDVTCTLNYNGWFQGTVEELMLQFAEKLVKLYTQITTQTIQNYLQQKRLSRPTKEFNLVSKLDDTESDTEYFEVENDLSEIEEVKYSLLAEISKLADAAQSIEARVSTLERAIHQIQDSLQIHTQTPTPVPLEQSKNHQQVLSTNLVTPQTQQTDKSDSWNLLTTALIGGAIIVWPIIAFSAWKFADKFLKK